MIEKCQIEDLVDCVSLAAKLWPTARHDELMAEFKKTIESNEQALFLHYEEGLTNGFAQVSLRHDYVPGTNTSPVGYLEGIYVLEEARHQKNGTALLLVCEIWAKQQGCQEFASDTQLGNHESEEFHKGLGFTESERIICFHKKL